MPILIEKLAHNCEQMWDAYMRDKGASLYHDSRWQGLIKQVFGHQSHHLVAIEEGRMVGGLPLVQLKSWMFGNYLVSMPYFNYGGIVANSDLVAQQLLRRAGLLCQRLQASHIEYRFDQELPEPLDSSLHPRLDKVSMRLQLPEEADQLWAAIGAKRRAQAKRPIREGAIYKSGGVELLADFYQVFSHRMHELGTPVYSLEFFRQILSRFGDESSIGAVYIEGQVVAAGFLMGRDSMLEIPWAASLSAYNRFGVNMFLYWNVLQQAIENGYKIFDFGRSSKDSPTMKFKSQWGAQPMQLAWYYHLADGQGLPNLTPDNKKYQRAIALWRKLPLSVTQAIGPHIVKNLP